MVMWPRNSQHSVRISFIKIQIGRISICFMSPVKRHNCPSLLSIHYYATDNEEPRKVDHENHPPTHVEDAGRNFRIRLCVRVCIVVVAVAGTALRSWIDLVCCVELRLENEKKPDDKFTFSTAICHNTLSIDSLAIVKIMIYRDRKRSSLSERSDFKKMKTDNNYHRIWWLIEELICLLPPHLGGTRGGKLLRLKTKSL